MDCSGLHHIAIAGAAGQMGGLLRECLQKNGCHVALLEKESTPQERAAALKACDILFLCVPVTAMEAALQAVKPFLQKYTILADVCSVKVLPIKAMIKAHDGPVVGTHPLFGAEIPKEFKPRIAITPGGKTSADRHAAAKVSTLMKSCGFMPFETTAEAHDRAMAYIQGLNFTATAAYLAAVRDVPDVENYITPSFKRRLDAAKKMFTQDIELFEVISEENPYLQEVSRSFLTYLSLAAGGDLPLLAERASWWWEDKKT